MTLALHGLKSGGMSLLESGSMNTVLVRDNEQCDMVNVYYHGVLFVETDHIDTLRWCYVRNERWVLGPFSCH